MLGRLKSRFSPFSTTNFNSHGFRQNARIDAAMAQLDSQETLNYAAAARAFGIHSTTLARRCKGKTVPEQK
jgi:hypothetical protein